MNRVIQTISWIVLLVVLSACIPEGNAYRDVYEEFLQTNNTLSQRYSTLADIRAIVASEDEVFRQGQEELDIVLWREAYAQLGRNVFGVGVIGVTISMVIIIMIVLAYSTWLGYLARFSILLRLRRKRRITRRNAAEMYKIGLKVAAELPSTATQPRLVSFPTPQRRDREIARL